MVDQDQKKARIYFFMREWLTGTKMVDWDQNKVESTVLIENG